jgi:putative transcriptional regulator
METGDRIVKNRNIANEVLEGIREIKSGRAARRTVIDVPVEIKRIRDNLGMSQAEFASLLCVSKRTLQEWEQGRCKPTGAALKLLLVASRHPEALHV